jgi:drug/metabolite transporter (DMT)-like permease
VSGAISPVLTTLLAVPLFGEPITAGIIVALALIVGGVIAFNLAPSFSASRPASRWRRRSAGQLLSGARRGARTWPTPHRPPHAGDAARDGASSSQKVAVSVGSCHARAATATSASSRSRPQPAAH